MARGAVTKLESGDTVAAIGAVRASCCTESGGDESTRRRFGSIELESEEAATESAALESADEDGTAADAAAAEEDEDEREGD